jgi:hypothetical protein
MNAAEWIRLEIRVFFGLLLFGVLFIFLSFLRKPFNLLKSLDEEADQAPALEEEIPDKIVENDDNF